jgi:ABC-type uncharacterized transport system ATPase subunit
MTGPLAGGADASPAALEVSGISKTFGTVRANRDISLAVKQGSIHGIVGENGAGKSTLMNILYGLYTADEGEIRVNGEPVLIGSSADAIRHGIGMVHQHFMLVRTFSVLENVMLGAEQGFTLGSSAERTLELIERMGRDYGLSLDPDALIANLPVGLQQRVEIVKALRGGARILILDEPTGVLTPQETEGLFAILRALRDEGATILLITHKLHEIMALTDSVSVMRQGEMVAHRATKDTSSEELAELMVGRKVLLAVKRGDHNAGAPAITVRGLGLRDEHNVVRLHDINFDLCAGEILAIAGVAGNGQSELLDVLAGITTPSAGVVEMGGRNIDKSHPASPAQMRELGLFHVPEDRHHRGLVLPFDAADNSILGFHNGPEAGTGIWLDNRAIAARAAQHIADFDVRPPLTHLRASQYSGGNQQKLVLAREISAAPTVLLVGQPTRGVDIGAIEFIYQRLMALREAGCAIALVSVELEEVMSLADRILVMNNGRQMGLVHRDEADEQRLGLMMAGIVDKAGQESAA